MANFITGLRQNCATLRGQYGEIMLNFEVALGINIELGLHFFAGKILNIFLFFSVNAVYLVEPVSPSVLDRF